MATFENVIGYDELKQDLLEVVDILQNKEVYEAYNVSSPSGLLLYGRPGVGKTLIAKEFIKASGRPSVVCRKNASEQSFVDGINQAFNEAVDLAPSIILLDDMDKFANDDNDHKDSEAYVTIQSCIDAVKGGDVFVLATANDTDKLPGSLIRTGRFDYRIKVDRPSEADSEKIIAHYLEGKGLSEDVNITALAKLFCGSSCSTLETVINQAGIIAGYRRADHVTMEDLIQGYIQIAHHVPKDQLRQFVKVDLNDPSGLADVFWHEAAHAVIAELLVPGSISLIVATLTEQRKNGFNIGDFRKANMDLIKSAKTQIMIGLAPYAAIDLVFGRVDYGAKRDLHEILSLIDSLNEENAAFAGFGMMSLGYECSQSLMERQEIAATSILNLYYWETKELLSRNRSFLEAVALALMNKNILTASDIAQIRESVGLPKAA